MAHEPKRNAEAAASQAPAARRNAQAGGPTEPSPRPLALLRAVSNAALKTEALPRRIKIFACGDNPSIKGTFKVGAKSAAHLCANQRAHGFERVALDYNHCSVPGTPEYEKLLKAGQPPIIFGYGRPAVVPGDGLYLEDMEWTPLGVEKARNFEDLSPAASARSGEVDFIHSVALTTNGCLRDVTFFSTGSTECASSLSSSRREAGHLNPAKRPAAPSPQLLGEGRGDAARFSSNTKPSNPIPMLDQNQTPLTVALLAGALGLNPDATAADLARELQALCALKPLSALVHGDQLLAVPTADFTALNTRVKAIETAHTKNVALLSAVVDGKTVTLTGEDVVKLAGRLDRLETDFAGATQEARNAETARIINLLSSEGKAPLNPETRKAYTLVELQRLDLPTLRLLHANTPATVPLHSRNRVAVEQTLNPNLKGRARMEAAFEAESAK
jgi:hypothetical protein